MSLTPSVRPVSVVCVNELAVVFVAFDSMQPIDVVRPHEVFANGGSAAASLGRRAEYQVIVAGTLLGVAVLTVIPNPHRRTPAHC